MGGRDEQVSNSPSIENPREVHGLVQWVLTGVVLGSLGLSGCAEATHDQPRIVQEQNLAVSAANSIHQSDLTARLPDGRMGRVSQQPATLVPARIAPAGTPELNREALSSLPVAPADKAPVGGVSLTGLHIDRVSMGTDNDGRNCLGEPKRFSVGSRKRATICFRAVHGRVAEEVGVMWKKEGITIRRARVIIPSTHSYRSRAYLALREEYVGEWSVHLVANDGTELASQAFSVLR